MTLILLSLNLKLVYSRPHIAVNIQVLTLSHYVLT